MNKTEQTNIAEGYEVRDGIIRSPGKFEGEPVYALHFYDAMLNGGGDITVYDGDIPCELFTISDEDRKLFPDDFNGYASASLIESNQGFVYCRLHEEPIETLEKLFEV